MHRGTASPSPNPSASPSTDTTPRHHNDHQNHQNHRDPDADQLPLPVSSPTHARTINSLDRAYFPHQPKSLAGIAVRAFGLGAALSLSVAATVAILAWTSSPLWRLPFFFATLSTFHFLEFWATAAFNTPAASVSSFLLSANWPGYAIAHAAASTECLLTNVLWPRRSWAPFPGAAALVLAAGLLLVITGQAARTAAMAQAGRSFNHIVQHSRKADHALVTTGLYARVRHPAYFGFFWWALGTQLALGNAVCFVGYALVLWRFFRARIRREEEYLVGFFGGKYVDYRAKVGTMIPFIP